MKLLWTDLETSGLDPRDHEILEIAVAEATLEEPFKLGPMFSWVLPIPLWLRGENNRYMAERRKYLHPKVLEMHQQNGLWRECDETTTTFEQVRECLLDMVPHVLDPEERTVIAGSTVFFDLDFLRADPSFREVAGRLSHRCYDVSAIKLFCRSFGMPKLPKAEAHRAAQDIRESVDHARQCAKWLEDHGCRTVFP